MPEPGDTRPARLTVTVRDPAWEWVFAPVVRGVELVSGRLNGLQFLTIRRYLMMMFFALVALLAIVAVVQR